MPTPLYERQIDSILCSKVFYFKEIGSTNQIAQKYLEEGNMVGFVIVAEKQTAGYGQRGVYWESPQGGLWCSLAIKPELELNLLGLVPILSVVGVAEALRRFNVYTTLKWPNDLLIKQNLKKLGGILVEGKITQFSLNYLIIGIGLNINNRNKQYSRSLSENITSTFEELSQEINLDSLLMRIIQQIEQQFELIKNQGAQAIISAWKKEDNILGMEVIIETPKTRYKGKAVDISLNGHLILETSDGNTVTLSNGTVKFS